jgi:hypothetical protein
MILTKREDMADTSLFYWQEKFGKTQVRELCLQWKITGAKTVSPLPMGQPVLTAFDAIATQAIIDDFLGTTNEFLVAAFDATAMGADTFACIVNMAGQASYVSHVKVNCFSGTGGSTLVTRAVYESSLTASTLETALELGANGNIAFKVDFGNTPDFDGLTDGLIEARVYWISK